MHVSALQPVAPPSKTEPLAANLAILLPRCEVAPVALARYLLSDVLFALLMPVDLLAIASAPNLYRQSPHAEIAARFAKARKITILANQMTWIIGNLDDCHPLEMFANALCIQSSSRRAASSAVAAQSPNESSSFCARTQASIVRGTVPLTSLKSSSSNCLRSSSDPYVCDANSVTGAALPRTAGARCTSTNASSQPCQSLRPASPVVFLSRDEKANTQMAQRLPRMRAEQGSAEHGPRSFSLSPGSRALCSMWSE